VSRFTVLDAPSNLGLRRPSPGVEPGARRLADALRGCGLVEALSAGDAGRVEAPPYTELPENRAAIPAYTRALADRLGALLEAGERPLVLGGDCSILLGATLALRRMGRFGLAYLDGSADFLRMSDAGLVGAAAAETLALVTGRGQDDVVNIDDLGPYVREPDIVVLGNRDDDEDLPFLDTAGIPFWTAPQIQAAGPKAVGIRARDRLSPLDGYFVHLDADVLDIEVLPAVDAPDPGGLTHPELADLLRPLLADPRCVGMQLTIYDPDLDPDGRHAAALTDTLVTALTDRLG
jgi:arginase